MARNKKDKNKVPKLTIFEEEQVLKLSAKEVLELAKRQDAEKMKSGHRFVKSADGKTKTLTKNKK